MENLKIKQSNKEENETLRKSLEHDFWDHDILAMEEIVGRKWAGREITDSAFWSGRLCEASAASFTLINRSKIRWHIGQTKTTTDSVIIRSLIKRFTPDIYQQFVDKELTQNKMINAAREEYFKGFIADIWQAYALGVTWYDLNVN
jgi:hypothetical protein